MVVVLLKSLKYLILLNLFFKNQYQYTKDCHVFLPNQVMWNTALVVYHVKCVDGFHIFFSPVF
jgi:hypothetical protein